MDNGPTDSGGHNTDNPRLGGRGAGTVSPTSQGSIAQNRVVILMSFTQAHGWLPQKEKTYPKKLLQKWVCPEGGARDTPRPKTPLVPKRIPQTRGATEAEEKFTRRCIRFPSPGASVFHPSPGGHLTEPSPHPILKN